VALETEVPTQVRRRSAAIQPAPHSDAGKAKETKSAYDICSMAGKGFGAAGA